MKREITIAIFTVILCGLLVLAMMVAMSPNKPDIFQGKQSDIITQPYGCDAPRARCGVSRISE